MVKHIIQYALTRNRAYGKQLEFTMVSNLSLMDEEKLAYLVDAKVQICTSIDGPEPLHTKQRLLVGGNAHAATVKWIERINKAYADIGLDPTLYHVEALLTTTREALKYPREIVDHYVSWAAAPSSSGRSNPFGFAGKTAKTIEYDRAAYRDFYRTAVDHILDKNRRGEQVLERYAAHLPHQDPRRRRPQLPRHPLPGRLAIGQLAYSYDGKIYTSDEGRMLAAGGVDMFEIGDVHTSKYREVMTHPTVRALVLASIREVQPRLRELHLRALLRHPAGAQPAHHGQHLRPDAGEHAVQRAQGHPGLPVREAARR